MVKITLDTENYDKIVETINSLDSYIKKWEKEEFKPNKFDNLVRSVFENGEVSPENRKQLRLLNKQSHIFTFPYFEKGIQEKKKKIGRPKKSNELKPGRPKIIFKKSPSIEKYCESILKISIFYDLFYDLLDGNYDSIDILEIEKDTDFIKRIIDNDSYIISYCDIDYVILQILTEYNIIISFRFLDTILNYALIIRLPKIIKVLQDKNIIFEKWLNPEFRNSL